ncbi:uncharacterized protein LOC120118819 [Hibiscus syriacus]|uniref:uncharacterized protein LOC120118819 n=1 Tax=Hibiscus syriacus TaxID=106335 RepID=UPI00192203B7|nr:uncharacterized protein LOC120118819 [Hibiscus syriacus]
MTFAPAEGSTGGLICGWNPNFLDASDNIIYHRFIALVGRIRGSDFNAYLNSEEKIGLSENSRTIEIFRNFVQRVRLVDLPLEEGTYTWCNNQFSLTFVRLDRFLVAAEVIHAFPNLSQKLLSKELSGHKAILLYSTTVEWGPKPFKFYNYWRESDGFGKFVTNSFKVLKSAGGYKSIGQLLRNSKKSIKQWYASSRTDIQTNIESLETNIWILESKTWKYEASANLFLELHNLKTKLWHVYLNEE